MSSNPEHQERQPNPNLQIVASIDSLPGFSNYAIKRFRNIHDPNDSAFIDHLGNIHDGTTLSVLPDNFKGPDLYIVVILYERTVEGHYFFNKEGDGIQVDLPNGKVSKSPRFVPLALADYEQVFELLRQIKAGDMLEA